MIKDSFKWLCQKNLCPGESSDLTFERNIPSVSKCGIFISISVLMCPHHNPNEKENIMSKGEDRKKTEKKAPAKTPEEKKVDKKIKKAEKKK